MENLASAILARIKLCDFDDGDMIEEMLTTIDIGAENLFEAPGIIVCECLVINRSFVVCISDDLRYFLCEAIENGEEEDEQSNSIFSAVSWTEISELPPKLTEALLNELALCQSNTYICPDCDGLPEKQPCGRCHDRGELYLQ